MAEHKEKVFPNDVAEDAHLEGLGYQPGKWLLELLEVSIRTPTQKLGSYNYVLGH